MPCTEQPPFFADVTQIPDGLRVVVAGELDVATAPAFSAALKDAVAAGGSIELDLLGVTFMDSKGLGALIDAQRHAGDERPFVVVEASRAVRKLLKVTSLDRAFGTDRIDPPSQVIAGAVEVVTTGAADAKAAYDGALDQNDDSIRSGRNPQFGRGALEVLRRRADDAVDAVVVLGEATGEELDIPTT